MNNPEQRILPPALAHEVETWVSNRISDTAKYNNTEPLDDNGVYTLYLLAASIYAKGFTDGETLAEVRASSRRYREHERQQRERRDAKKDDDA